MHLPVVPTLVHHRHEFSAQIVRSELCHVPMRLIPSSDLSQQTEAMALHNQLWTIFTLIFEPVLTLWTGPDCSPYVVPDHLLVLGNHLWNNAKARVTAVFDKLSYQTVLALYLFGLTPIAEEASMDIENAYMAGEVSIDMALRQIHRLRVKRRDLRFSGTGLSFSKNDGKVPNAHNSVNEDFIHAENMMYWAGVVFDTSSSMTRGCPSILCSGVFGFEEEPVFCLMKARVQLFHESTEAWRQNGFIPTSHDTLYIVHRASTWKGYVWKLIGVLREAMNHGYGESVIARLQSLIAEALDRFDKTFRPLLAACEKHILFFSKDARLCYYLLLLHYHMGLLLLCSLTASIERTDIVTNFDAVRRESVHTIFSTISFGLSCRVALGKGEAQRRHKLSSLISLDPYPHHILASLQLAAEVLLIYLERDEIAQDAFDSFCRIMFDALDELPQYLQSVQRVRKILRESLNAGIGPADTSSDTLPMKTYLTKFLTVASQARINYYLLLPKSTKQDMDA
ncbi:hypothetical protein ACHAPV_007335 [Trichoderma viride]